jgi:sterol desaturase/sphingolipid hydroxylase (fatty acid hydroxylase superfamily)
MPEPREKSGWPWWLTPAVVAGSAAVIFVAETLRPLRLQRESRARRTGRNLTMAGLTAASVSALQAPLLDPLVRKVEREGLGLLHALPLSRTARRLVGVLLLDYTLWWWHWLNHEVPFFWRFHLVHHVDRDLDASTAIRFHFGEMSLSVFYRMAQVRLLGVDSVCMGIWQGLLLVSIFFHHSNIRLSPEREAALVKFIVTPRMHGIHHSDYAKETNTNWSSLLSWWDSLHGTMKLDVAQEEIRIGVPAYQREEDVTLPRIVAMPFEEQKDDWFDGERRKIERPVIEGMRDEG